MPKFQLSLQFHIFPEICQITLVWESPKVTMIKFQVTKRIQAYQLFSLQEHFFQHFLVILPTIFFLQLHFL